MRALVYHGPQDIRPETRPDPSPQSLDATVVRVRRAGICGSDLHIYHGHGFTADPGYVVGHEAVGEIVEIGSGVRRFLKLVTRWLPIGCQPNLGNVMKRKISKRAVDQLNPGEGDALLWDTAIPGFGVRCRASGAKYYFLKFRAPGGRQRWLTIGKHGAPWTPEAARREANRLLGEVAGRSDPAEAKAREKDQKTVAQLCDQYLEAAPFIILPKKGRPKKSSTLQTDRSNIERHIKPLLGQRPVRAPCGR